MLRRAKNIFIFRKSWQWPKFWDFKISLWHLKGVSGKLESSSAVQTKRLWFKLPRWWAQLVSLVVVSDMPAGESRPQGANLIKARNYISRLKQLENAEHPAGHCQFNPDQKAMPPGGFCNWILYLVEENYQNDGAKFGKHWIEESFLNIDTGLLTGLQKRARVFKRVHKRGFKLPYKIPPPSSIGFELWNSPNISARGFAHLAGC